ncbi:MAG: helicase-related protein [Lentisphaeria bacterium]|nr:helicase-related protein [Lentisphaeria bacterium]
MDPEHSRKWSADAKNSAIWDNRARGAAGDFLRARLSDDSEFSSVSAYFTIYAYARLRSHLENLSGFRFLFGEPRFVLDPEQDQAKAFDFEEGQLKLRGRLQQKQIARDCADWIKRKAEIRSITQAGLLHGKMYHVKQPNGLEHALVGSSNFTVRGLGFSDQPNIELNLELNDRRDIQDLLCWFDELWTDAKLTKDVKQDVLDYLERLYSDTSPEFIYYLTLFHVFKKFLEDQSRAGLLEQETGFFETKVWNTLFEFQKHGATGAINKILQHNGCIIADSVGLGKTFEALAVIKYFELLNNRVLVMCPKKLFNNWSLYKNNDCRNILADDKLRYDIVCHTDMSRHNGGVNDDGLDLENLNWGNYDLLVIDESHNFRNDAYGKTEEDGTHRPTRYERVMEEIVKNGIKTKVLLLSATPVNNSLRDLRNQLYFITGKRDKALKDSAGIADIGGTLKTAQLQFKNWADPKRAKERSLQSLLERLDSGFFKLLDEMTIARSRKHVVSHYDLKAIGKFPARMKPTAEHPELDLANMFPSYDKLHEEIGQFKLSLYNPSEYVQPCFFSNYDIESTVEPGEGRGKFDEQKTREQSLIGMMRVNFLKRLESSVTSFAATMERTIRKIDDLLTRISDFDAARGDYVQPDMIEAVSAEDIEGDEELEEIAERFAVGKKLKFQFKHLDLDRWKEALKADRDQLCNLYNIARAVTPARDGKLAKIKEVIAEKLATPINSGNRKVLVFTAFADTANYLYDNLRDWVKSEFGIHAALVSGGSVENRTTFDPKGFTRQTHFDAILTNFSPISKGREKMGNMPQEEEIDLLIATDCISEGQNLQDCDMVVNYDIHWNPVRIIQRFGRIDRLGSINQQVKLVNFWPTDDLNQYIGLKERVETRMALVDLAATGEDNLLGQEQLKDLIHEDLTYREKQLLRLKDEILDLEDLEENINLSDFTLDDFRVDLLNYLQANKEQLESAPLGLYAVVPPPKASGTLPGLDPHANLDRIVKPGVVFCLRQTRASDGLDRVNPLQPYFLVYIRDDGTVRYNFAHPKQILSIFQACCLGRASAHDALCRAFDEDTHDGKDMTKYDDLLKKALKAVEQHFNRRNLANLFSGRGGKLVASSDKASGLDDFELVTWLVIRDREGME